jgi:hypothetical protein
MGTLYAYRYTDGMDYARSRGVPVTGWLHAVGGPPWRVVADSAEQLARIPPPPRTTVQVYDGDEPTITFEEAFPLMARPRPLTL